MKIISEEIPSRYPRYYLKDTDRPTFVGVLEKYFYKRSDYNYYISEGLNTKRTIEDCIEDYCNSIIPMIEKVLDIDKPIDLYEEKDFYALLEALREEKGLEEVRVKRYKNLLFRVYEAAVENIPGFIPKFSYDNGEKGLRSYREDYSGATNETVRILLIPKSFTIEQELHILELFRDEDINTMDGVRLGFFLMFFLGMRNEECCGASWDDIITPFSEYPEKKAIVIHTSFKDGTLRTTLKRKNSYRILPLIPYLAEKLEERRRQVEEVLGDISREKVPIACSGDDFRKRIRPEDLTAYGREFIRKEIGEPSKLSAISEMIAMLESQNVQIGEKEPTTYLTRRAFGTHLRNIGFEAEEIEFLMGHSIENESVRRFHLAATDSLQRMFKMFEKHPFYTFYSDESKTIDGLSIAENEVEREQKNKHRYVIEVNEPCDQIDISIPDVASGVEMVCSTANPQYGDYVDISRIVNPRYSKKKD